MPSDITLVQGQQNTVANTIETFFTSPAGEGGTVITAFTASNNTASNKTYKAYIFTAAGDNEGAIIPVKIVKRKRFDVGASIVNQIIPAGGTLRMESSEADSIIFTVSGKNLP